jgi:RimJ/RimL family protein N-acetyltransferase
MNIWHVMIFVLIVAIMVLFAYMCKRYRDSSTDVTKLRNVGGFVAGITGGAIVSGAMSNTDDFPYMRQWHSDKTIHRMMDNLKEYDGRTRLSHVPYTIKSLLESEIDFVFEGEPLLIINKSEDYWRFNKLSDMFQERCRMRCNVKHQLSPHEYYMKNMKSSVSNMKNVKKRKQLRERIWKKSHECTSHRPNIMKTLIQMFGSKSVLDPTAGWGDRLISAISSDVEYCGVDLNPCVFEGYADIIKFFEADSSKYTMIQGNTLEVDVPDRAYDLVFTSPPYFDYEQYSEDENRSEKKWFDEFLAPCLKKYWGHLTVGGRMAININQVSPKLRYIKWMIDYVSEFTDSRYTGVLSYSNESIDNPQPIWTWEKVIVSTDRLYLRKFKVEDIPRMSEIYASPANMANIANGRTFTPRQTDSKIRTYIKEGYTLYPIVLHTGTIVGLVGYINGKWMNIKWRGRKMLRTIIDKDHRRRGYATEALQSFISQDVTGEFYSLMGSWNSKMIELAKKIGFSKIETVNVRGKKYDLYKSAERTGSR